MKKYYGQNPVSPQEMQLHFIPRAPMHSSVDSLAPAVQALAAETDTHACFLATRKNRLALFCKEVNHQSCEQPQDLFPAPTNTRLACHSREQRSAPGLTGVRRRMEVKVLTKSGMSSSTFDINIACHQSFESEINVD